MIWKGLAVTLNTVSPVVVVLSGSMEPAFYRGDLLFLSLPRDRNLRIGEIPVFEVPEGKIPIVHRLIENHDEPNQERQMLSKGDNNGENDVGLYNGLKYLTRSNLIGKVNGYVPYVGYVTIVMVRHLNLFLYYTFSKTDLVSILSILNLFDLQNDYPKLKYALLATLGLTILFHRE